MTSERVQHRIDSLLDEADQAISQDDWPAVRQRANAVLAFDAENADALAYLAAADKAQPENFPGVAAPPAAPEAPPGPPLPTSFVNGRYEVERFLSEGGKKNVYLAHDTTLDRDVAFALIKTEGLDDASRRRITREAQAMGRLGDHPNIVTVYDIGEEAGQPYMVLPLLFGGDVEGMIEKAENHKLSLEEAIRIASEICEGLVLAPRQGHRSSRSKAWQRLAYRKRHGENRRLRPRCGRGPLTSHPGWNDGWNRRIHAPRTGRGWRGHPTKRSLFVGLHAVRNGHWPTTVRR